MQFNKQELRLFKKNKKCFQEKFPDLYDAYLNKDLPENIEIYRRDDELDILINGNRFYGEDASVFTGKQIEAYLQSPAVMEISPPGATEDRTPTQVLFYKKFDKQAQKLDFYAFHDRVRVDVATTFVFGVGLGMHLYPLVAHTCCRELVVVEPEPVFILLSMYFIDWGKLIKSLKGKLAIIVKNHADTAYLLMRTHITVSNPAVQQCLFHYTHYRAPYVDAILREFENKAQYFFDGLGFYDDEKNMMRNHFLNMYQTDWKLCSPTPVRVKGSAVVVGAGPSLNTDLVWLRENQGELIIFSGGSSLQTLLKNGIVPDFHVEIENISMNYDLIKPLVDNYDLSKVILICSSTMDTRAAYLFDRRMWFFREGVTCSRMFENLGVVTTSNQNPTVVNTALSAALTLGFRNILMLGADFGTRNQAVHHSKDTVYETFEELKSAQFEFPEKIPANFGGNVYTNAHYQNGLISIEHLLLGFRTAMVFNASDGAAIPKTIPLRSKNYKIDTISNKRYLVNILYDRTSNVDWREIAGKDFFDDVCDDFSEFCERARKNIREASRQNRDFISYLSRSYSKMIYTSEGVEYFFSMISGTLTSIDIFLLYWWRRMPPEKLHGFERLSRSMRLRFIKIVEKDFKRFIGGLKADLPLVRPELFDHKGNLIVEARPGVHNAE